MAKQERRQGESIDAMLRKFRKKMKDEGILNDYRGRQHFEKPSDIKKRKAKAAVRRTIIQQKADDLT